MKKPLAIITVLFTFSALVPVTQAGFSMIPSDGENRRQFNMELNPGETKTDSIVIENNNEQPLTLLLYGADATHSNQGSFALVNRTATQRTIGSWVKFKESTVTLQGGEQREIPFTVEMPEKVTPGNYAGGIAAETTTVQNDAKKQNNGGTGAGVVISSRLVVKLFISVPGEKTVKYNWLDYNRVASVQDKQRFTMQYGNEGNAAVSVEPKIEFSGLGVEPQEVKIPGTLLLQNEKVTIPYDWDKKPFFAVVTAKATTTFSEYDVANDMNINPEVITKSITFWVVPWNYAAVVLVALVLIAIYCTSKCLTMNKLKKTAKSYEVQEGDTLVSIAEKAGIAWKKLAKLNKLKPPYTVKKGARLQVPFKK